MRNSIFVPPSMLTWATRILFPSALAWLNPLQFRSQVARNSIQTIPRKRRLRSGFKEGYPLVDLDWRQPRRQVHRWSRDWLLHLSVWLHGLSFSYALVTYIECCWLLCWPACSVYSCFLFISLWLWLPQGFDSTWTLQPHLCLKVIPEASLSAPASAVRSPIFVSQFQIPEGNLIDRVHLFMLVQVLDLCQRWNALGSNFSGQSTLAGGQGSSSIHGDWSWGVSIGAALGMSWHTSPIMAYKPAQVITPLYFSFQLLPYLFGTYNIIFLVIYLSFVSQMVNTLRSETRKTEVQEP